MDFKVMTFFDIEYLRNDTSNVSVCLSVCLSHAGIVSKQIKISSNFFLGLVAPPLWFCNTTYGLNSYVVSCVFYMVCVLLFSRSLVIGIIISADYKICLWGLDEVCKMYLILVCCPDV